jgi:hypothetical protein
MVRAWLLYLTIHDKKNNNSADSWSEKNQGLQSSCTLSGEINQNCVLQSVICNIDIITTF